MSTVSEAVLPSRLVAASHAPPQRPWRALSLRVQFLLLAAAASCLLAVMLAIALLELRHDLNAYGAATLQRTVEAATGILEHFAGLERSGQLTGAEADARAREALNALRHDDSYVFAYDRDGRIVVHGADARLIGQPLSGQRGGNGVDLYTAFEAALRHSGQDGLPAGFVSYPYARPGADGLARKLSYVRRFEPWGWTIGSGVYLSGLDAQYARLRNDLALAVGLTTLLLGGLLFWQGRRLLGRVHAVLGFAQRLAAGDLDVRLPQPDAQDELGRMAEALNTAAAALAASNAQAAASAAERDRLQAEQLEAAVQAQSAQAREIAEQSARIREAVARESAAAVELRDKVDRIVVCVEVAARGELTVVPDVDGDDAIGRVGTALARLLEDLRTSMAGIARNAGTLAGSVQNTRSLGQRLSRIAEASAEHSQRLSLAVRNVDDSVQSVSGATEHMHTAVSEIARNVHRAVECAAVAARATDSASAIVERLSASSAAIDSVTRLITGITEQTNLLALNATIEAARAGTAGRGFAVVAGEVKELARSTAEATADIGKRIEAIQRDTGQMVTAISAIRRTIDDVNDISTLIAAAIEQQSATTREISRSVQLAASGSAEITAAVESLAESALQVRDGASETGKDAERLARLAREQQELIARFRC